MFYMSVILVLQPHIRDGDDRLHLLAQVDFSHAKSLSLEFRMKFFSF